MNKPLDDDVTQGRWLVGTNADSAEIPAWSLVMVTATDDDGRHAVARPTTAGLAANYPVYVVGHWPIPAAGDEDGVGAVTTDWPAWAAYDPDDGTPAIGETWGPADGTFLLKKDEPGFTIAGDPDEDQEIVEVAGPAAGGSGCECGCVTAAVNFLEVPVGSPQPHMEIYFMTAGTQLVVPTTVTVVAVNGTVLVQAAILAGVPRLYLVSGAAHNKLYGRLGTLDSFNQFAFPLTDFVPLGFYVQDANNLALETEPSPDPIGSTGACFRQGVVAYRGGFLGNVRFAWVLALDTSASSPQGVVVVRNGPTHIIVTNLCENVAPGTPSPPPPTIPPPAPPPPNPLAPVAAFSPNNQFGEAPYRAGFVDNSTNSPTSWSWNFGDGGTSNVENPVHQYDDPGTYTVTLTACNAYGCGTTTGTVVVTERSIPPIRAIPSRGRPPRQAFAVDVRTEPTVGVVPLWIGFPVAVRGGTAPFKHVIDYGDGSGATSTDTTPGFAHTYNSLGTYTVTLTTVDATGQASVVRREVVVSASAAGTPLTCQLVFRSSDNDNDGPVGSTWDWRVHVAGGTPPYTYVVNYLDGTPHGTANVGTHVYTALGMYVPTVTVTDANGNIATDDDGTKDVT